MTHEPHALLAYMTLSEGGLRRIAADPRPFFDALGLPRRLLGDGILVACLDVAENSTSFLTLDAPWVQRSEVARLSGCPFFQFVSGAEMVQDLDAFQVSVADSEEGVMSTLYQRELYKLEVASAAFNLNTTYCIRIDRRILVVSPVDLKSLDAGPQVGPLLRDLSDDVKLFSVQAPLVKDEFLECPDRSLSLFDGMESGEHHHVLPLWDDDDFLLL